MPRMAVGRAAANLPWLCPNTTGLVALAERPADAPVLAAADPALLAFLTRFAYDPDAAPGPFPPQRLLSSSLPDTAAAYLAHTAAGWLDPLSSIVVDLDAVAIRAAELARTFATQSGKADPDAAATAARLAPLGWYAVAATNRWAAVACLRNPDFAADPVQCQRDHWGHDQHVIARRLALRWRFPNWLTAALGGLGLPDAVRDTGPFPDLAAIVTLAVAEAQRDTIELGLTTLADAGRVRDRLASGRRQPAVESTLESPEQQPADSGRSPGYHADPHRVPLVGKLLRAAAEARRRSGAALVLRLEDEVDDLHTRLVRVTETAAETRHAEKVAALAEFAAGAGHEINNPLAVISGHAQRLLRTEQDDDRADSLRAVVRQTQRIAGILKELMQFARPATPEPGWVVVAELFAGVRADLEPFAQERGVRIDVAGAPADAVLHADPKQLRQAVGAVVRNGIEAAGPDGWVRLGCEGVYVVVEDSGPGLTADAATHAFDPFFCGRPAGRGRGLGLPTAWQLARQNGGDLRHDSTADVTRFVFTFPPATGPGTLRKSA